MNPQAKTFKTLGLAAIAALTLLGCRDKNVQERTYTANVPVYVSFDEFRSSVASEEPQSLEKAGKIFFKDSYLFINNRENGIHVIDNRTPSSPINLAYIKIPGNREMAISGNLLFADSYSDLVVIDISDPTSITEVSRTKSVFPYSLPAHDQNYRVQQPDPEKGIVVGWELETITEVVQNGNAQEGFVDMRWDEDMFLDPNADPMNGDRTSFGVAGDNSRNAETGGISGSMAGFVLRGNYLYTLHGNDIEVFDVASQNAVHVNTVRTDRVVETLYPFGENLFVGTTNGMIIYNLKDAAKPTYESTFEHAQSCDPVAVNGNYAYVTLRSGRNCGGWSNQLDIIDISNIKFPKLVDSEMMESPYGIAADANTLFVCEGYNGMKIFDVEKPENIREINDIKTFSAMDAITFNGVLMIIGQDGLYQYDFSDLSKLTLLSSIQTR